MLNSTIAILNQYLDTVSRYNIYSLEMIRSENPDELYYFCEIDSKYYIVVESDYIGELSKIADQMVQSFDYLKVTPLHWLVRKTDYTSTKKPAIAYNDYSEVDSKRSSLIAKVENSFYIYAVLEVDLDETMDLRFNPNKFGYTD